MRIHRALNEADQDLVVVNCFQNTNFSEDSQDTECLIFTKVSCELLSEY